MFLLVELEIITSFSEVEFGFLLVELEIITSFSEVEFGSQHERIGII